MGLREDMDILERHIKRGTGKAYLLGEADPLPPEPYPSADRKPPFGGITKDQAGE